MNKKIGNIFKGDKVIWMVFFFLCMISIVEVFSASSGLTYKSQNFISPILKHTGTIVMGLFIAVVTLNIPCKYFKLMTPFLLLISFITLLWVLMGGETINGANRVIEIPGFTFQPSEIAKGTMILAEAQILSAMQRENGADKDAFKYILWLAIPIVCLIGLENLSTAAMLFGIVIIMMYIGRVPYKQLGKLVGIIAGMVVVGFIFIMVVGHAETPEEAKLTKTETIDQTKKKSKIEKLFHRADTWKGRILNFGKGEVSPLEYDLDKDAQVAHANIAIVSSGNAIIVEELGIIGAAFVVLLYIILLYRAARIASRCENNFPALLVMGLGLLLVVQAVFNMMVAVGLAPVTGQPLPLISKGGTSTIINCAYIGAILSVSRSAKVRNDKKESKV